MKLAPVLVSLAVVSLAPRAADAFCGFYVNQGDQPLYNDATQVVLMRMGTRTVLSMQNDYKGPPEAFAMVIPVPVVLKAGDVKTLSKDVFKQVDLMGSPRLVEYWEQDPCMPHDHQLEGVPQPTASVAKAGAAAPRGTGLGVTVEAKFTVGEYQVVILSAKDSTGLATWLAQEKYQIPAGAEPLLRPYVESGMKFFVAKVDPQKVKFEAGRAALSPLRFHYDSEELSLPIRLGLASSSGTQDLIVNILAPRQRYNVANYANVTIPTNLDVSPQMKDKFGAFYAALFDKTLEKHPNAVVTEYAWQATTCDPCPGPALGVAEFATLGADVLRGPREKPEVYASADFVLTRLHARYGKTLKDDLRFQEAPGIVGGREFRSADGKLEEGASPASLNNFQGRYAIRHPWSGPIACEKPQRGVWGGPPRDVARTDSGVTGATDLGLAPRGEIQLASAVMQDVPEIDLKSGASTAGMPTATGSAPAPGAAGSAMATTPTTTASKPSGCGCATSDRNEVLGGALLVGASLLVRRRRRRGPRGA